MMTGRAPLVSAIVSTYNAERFIKGKLEDLEAQTIAQELEIIVIDSGSRENERAIVEEFQRRYSNIRYIRTDERETVYQAWNRGIRAARGEFVTNANTDDRLRRDCYEVLVRALREHPRSVLAYPDMRITRQENATFEGHQPFGFRDWPEFDRISLLELCCVGPFPLWRRSLHDELGYFDERFKSAADYEFWLRAALKHDFIHVPDFLGLYWLSEETVSRKGDLPTLEYLEVQKEYRPKYAPLTPPPAVLSPEDEAGYEALLARVAAGPPQAVAELQRFTDLHPRWPRGHHDLAELFYKHGEIGYAKKHFEKAAIVDPASAAYRDKLQAFMRMELYGSLQYHTAQAAEKPEVLETQLTLGMICILLERFDAARVHYLRALAMEPNNALVRENRAYLDRQDGEQKAENTAGYYGFNRPEVQRLVSRKAKTVLDIGCASGKVGAGIKHRQGATVWGIEVSDEAAARAGKVLDRVITAPVEEALAEVPQRHFDAVILADVLEHLVDPERVLIALAEKLSADGEVVVSLPNVRHWSVLEGLLEGSWEYEEAGILDRTHLRFFTRVSAVRMFERAGYAVKSVTPVMIEGDGGIPEEMLKALRQGGVKSPTLQEEAAAYQYLFRLVPKAAQRTSIVILTFNELDCTKECLESIERNTPEPHEVILVDNGSTDGTLEWLKEFTAGKSGYRVIANGENLGFAAGCNIGMKASRGGHILLLNNDVVVTRGWLGGLLDCLQRGPRAAIVGPMTNEIAGPQRLLTTSYRTLDQLEQFASSFRVANSGRRLPVDRLVGFCMLFTRGLVESVGELDTRFGSGNFEDDDFCLRAALAGYGCVIAGDVFVHHYGSRSFKGNGIDYAAAMTRNRAKFDEKWHLGRLDDELASKVITRNALVKGWKLARQGRLNEAVDAFLHEGIRFSPLDPETFVRLAEVLAEAGSYQDAIEVLAQMPQGEEVAKLQLMALCRRGLGQSAEARELAEQGLALAPESPRFLCLKGVLAADSGDVTAAEGLFRRAIACDPGLGMPFTELSSILWQRGARDAALDSAEMGFFLSPLSMSALDRFHQHAIACEALTREEQRVREARAIYPEHKGLAFGLIEVLIRQGRYREAIAEIERAAVDFGLDEATIDAALEIRRFAGMPAPVVRGTGSVSVCMIVKDEVEHLPAVLASVKGFADEVIVVDTGSSDRSGDVARIFGARLFSFPWNGSFSDARNFSLSNAQGDWIMVLDADEALAATDLGPLKELVKRTTSPTAYSFTTRNYTEEITRKNWTANTGEYRCEERGRGWTPSDKVRLFPNDSRIRFQGAVHELLELSLMQCDIPIHGCDVPVHHYGRLDAAKNAEKQEHYYQLGLRKLAETGGSIESLTELAMQATELQRFQEAEALWHRVLELRPESVDAYFSLGYLHLVAGDYSKGRAHALRATELAPGMKEAAFNLAKCELFLGDISAAFSVAQKMLDDFPEYPPALSLLSVTLLLMGRKAEAEAIVGKLRRLHFDCGDFLKEYADGLMKGGHAELSATLLEFAGTIRGDDAAHDNSDSEVAERYSHAS